MIKTYTMHIFKITLNLLSNEKPAGLFFMWYNEFIKKELKA